MDPELKAILEDARAALASGYSLEEVNEILGKETLFRDFQQLEQYVMALEGGLPTDLANQSAIEAVEAITPAQRRLSEGGARGETARGDFATLGLQTMLRNFGDEALGENFGSRVEALEQEAPATARLAAGAAGVVPTALLPIARMTGAASGMIGKAATAIGLGAAEGYAQGMGASEGSARDRATSPEAAFGAVIGGGSAGVLGPVAGGGLNLLRRNTAGPMGRRIAEQMARLGGDMEASGPLGRLRNRVTGGKLADVPAPDARMAQFRLNTEDVARRVYGGYDATPPAPGLTQYVNAARQDPIYGAIVENAVDQTSSMDFRQMQRIHDALSTSAGRAGNATDEAQLTRMARRFGEEVEVSYPGYGEARRQFAMAKEIEEGFALGYTGARQSGASAFEQMAGAANPNLLRPAMLRQALRTFDDNPEAQDALRTGIRQRIMDDFLLDEEQASGMASGLLRMERDTRREVLREIFPTETAARAFEDVLQDADHLAPSTGLGESVLRSLMLRGAFRTFGGGR